MARRRLPSSLRGDEPDRLLHQSAGPRDRLLYQCGLYLGLRVSELVGLAVEDIDLSRGVCTVRHGKGDKDRAVPIPAKLLPELRAWIGERQTGWLFPSPRGAGHLSARAVQVSIRKAAQRAGIARHVTPHKLRHSYATNLLRRGADIVEIKELLGHSSIATTQVYLSADPERLRDAVDRL